MKNVRTKGPAYDFNMKTLSFFNPGFFLCKDKTVLLQKYWLLKLVEVPGDIFLTIK